MSDKTGSIPITSPSLLMYQTEDGKTRLQILIEGETIWMTQAQIADLYQTSIQNINLHVRNTLKEGELPLERTIKEYLIVQKEGDREVSRTVSHCNLEMIIAIGYRVRSHRGTQFRRWATDRLHEYLVKGFAMDDERALLGHAEKISMERARELAREQYLLYNAHRVEIADQEAEIEFEKVVHKLKSDDKK